MSFPGSIALIIVPVVIIIGSGYLLVPPILEIVHSEDTFEVAPFQSVTPSSVMPLSTQTNSPSPLSPGSVPAGWHTYRNEHYGFEVSYPSEFIFEGATQPLPPSLLALMGSYEGAKNAAFIQVIPAKNINFFPFSATFSTPIASLAELSDAFKAIDNTKITSIGLMAHVTVRAIEGEKGLPGIRAYVETDQPLEGKPIVGISYYFYKAPYFYRIATTLPESDPALAKVAATFKFTP